MGRMVSVSWRAEVGKEGGRRTFSTASLAFATSVGMPVMATRKTRSVSLVKRL